MRTYSCHIVHVQALGYNAIRMPFSMKDLWTLKPRVFNWDCAAVTPQAFLQSVTDPAVPFPSSAQSALELQFCMLPKLLMRCDA